MSNADDPDDFDRMLEEYRRYREYVSEGAPWLLDELERGLHTEQEAEALVSALRNTREETREDLQRLFARLAPRGGDLRLQSVVGRRARVRCGAGPAVGPAGQPANLLFSAARWSTRPQDLTELILGELSIQGNIKAARSLAEALQIGMENGARRALVPVESKRQFLEVPADIVERVDPVFYSDPHMATLKALGMT